MQSVGKVLERVGTLGYWVLQLLSQNILSIYYLSFIYQKTEKFWTKITLLCCNFEIGPKIMHFFRNFFRRMKYCRIFCPGMKFCVRSCMPLEKISYDRKKFSVTGRNVLSQDKVSSHRKKFPVTGRNFLLQDDIFRCRTKFPVTGWNFLSQEEISPVYISHYVESLFEFDMKLN